MFTWTNKGEKKARARAHHELHEKNLHLSTAQEKHCSNTNRVTGNTISEYILALATCFQLSGFFSPQACTHSLLLDCTTEKKSYRDFVLANSITSIPNVVGDSNSELNVVKSVQNQIRLGYIHSKLSLVIDMSFDGLWFYVTISFALSHLFAAFKS